MKFKIQEERERAASVFESEGEKKEEGTYVRLRVNYEVFVDCPVKFQPVVEQRFIFNFFYCRLFRDFFETRKLHHCHSSSALCLHQKIL